jgi:hypothetical protein
METQSQWTPDVAPPFALAGIGWQEAQAAVNFVLFRLDPLPRGLSVEAASVRPEAPPQRDLKAGLRIGNRAVHRFDLRGQGFRVRVKQFLYDWAPPAWDHPSLTGEVAPFVVGGHIGWLGHDFRGLDAATVTLDRTTIEMSVREGSCPEPALVALCHALRPVSAAARAAILATPFGWLSYRSRHPDRTPSVPVGYWHHRRGPPSTPVRILERPPPDLPGAHITPPARLGFHLDTVQVFGDLRCPQEVEYLYADAADRGRTIRILVSPAGAEGGVRFPPETEGQPCTVVRLRDVHYAFGDPRYGPHEAVWQQDGLNVMLLAKPAPFTDRYWFTASLSSLAPS